MKEFYDYFSKLYNEDINNLDKSEMSYKEWLKEKYPNYESAMKINNCIISIGASLIIAGIPISIVTKDMDFLTISLGGLVMYLSSFSNKNDKEDNFLKEYFEPKEQIIDEYENGDMTSSLLEGQYSLLKNQE